MATWKAGDGSLINFEIHGDAPNPKRESLLLLPGLLGSISTQWRPFVETLAADYRVIMLDYRGHGLSENHDTKLTLEKMLEDIVNLLDYLEARVIHVAGYSLGGYLGLMLAMNQPRRVPTLLMHATKFYWTRESVEKSKDQFDPDILAQKVPTYANQLAQEHGGGRWRMLVRQTADLIGYMSANGLTEGMAARVQIPVLVSVGDRDEMVALPESQRLSRVFPNGGMFVLPNVRHPFATLTPVPLIPMMKHFHRNNGDTMKRR